MGEKQESAWDRKAPLSRGAYPPEQLPLSGHLLGSQDEGEDSGGEALYR